MLLLVAASMLVVVLGCNSNKLFGRRTYSKRTFQSTSEALTTIRESKESWERRAAFEFLGNPRNVGQGESSRQEMLEILALALGAEQNVETRLTILESISQLDSSRHFEHVAPALNDKEPAVRQAACRLAGATGSAQAVPQLADLLASDPSLDVRLAAADALGHVQSPESAAALLPGIKDSDIALRFRCQQSLRRITGKDHGMRADEWQQEIETASFEQPSIWNRWLGQLRGQ